MMWNHTKWCTEMLQGPLRNLTRRSKFLQCSLTDVWILAMYSNNNGPRKPITKFEFIPEKLTSYDKAKLKEKEALKETKPIETMKPPLQTPSEQPTEHFIKISPVTPVSNETIDFPKISHQTPQYKKAEISKINKAVVEEVVGKNKVKATSILASLTSLKNLNTSNLVGKQNVVIAKQQQKQQKEEQKTKEKILLGQRLISEDDDEKSWRTMKYSLMVIGFMVTTVGSWMYFVLGAPKTDEDGNIIEDDELATLPSWQQYFWRMVRELTYYEKLIKEPSREKLLPDVVTYPYYQPPYTLVLELTDVLVHPEWSYTTGWRFKKRPGIDQFLESVAGQFEIVIYTAEMGMTVFPIIEALDPKNLIAYKLVRDATHFVDGYHVKDLDKLNRDLSKVIVIDWNHNATKLHQDNLFLVDKWAGNDNDNTLSDLAAFLRMVAQWEIDDVREVLRYYGRFDNALEVFNERRREMLATVEAS